MSEPIAVPETLAGDRIDSAVALITGWSRADVQALLARDAIVVDGRPVGKSHRLVAGTVIDILEEPAIGAPPAGDPGVAVDVRYADDDVVVVAKPAGLVVHPGAGHPDGTLVNGLLARYPEMAGVGDEMRPGIVHRLDRDTSGLLVAARTQRGYDSLVEQIGEPQRRPPVRRARVGRVQLAPRCGRRADRPLDRAPHAHGGARVGQGRAHGVRGARRVRTSPCARCSTAGSRPAARIRSACTSARSGTRSSATARTAARGRRSASTARSCTPPASRSTSRPRASASASRIRSPPTSPPCSTKLDA